MRPERDRVDTGLGRNLSRRHALHAPFDREAQEGAENAVVGADLLRCLHPQDATVRLHAVS
jgi:hypothetical protein